MMLPSLGVEKQMLVGAVADIFAEIVVCWVKPRNASILAWETCGILNTGARLKDYTRKNRCSLWLEVPA